MQVTDLKRKISGVWREFVVQDCRGEIAIELAVMASILVVLSIGVIDYSLAFSRKAEMSNAVRAGTQFALVRKPSLGPSAAEQEAIMSIANVRDAVVQSASFLSSDPGAPDLEVSVFCQCPDATPVTCAADPGVPLPCQDRITFLDVTLNQSYSPIMVYPGLPDSIDLKSSSIIRLN